MKNKVIAKSTQQIQHEAKRAAWEGVRVKKVRQFRQVLGKDGVWRDKPVMVSVEEVRSFGVMAFPRVYEGGIPEAPKREFLLEKYDFTRRVWVWAGFHPHSREMADTLARMSPSLFRVATRVLHEPDTDERTAKVLRRSLGAMRAK